MCAFHRLSLHLRTKCFLNEDMFAKRFWVAIIEAIFKIARHAEVSFLQ